MSTGLLPRDSVLVRFADDPTLWHQRIVLSKVWKAEKVSDDTASEIVESANRSNEDANDAEANNETVTAETTAA